MLLHRFLLSHSGSFLVHSCCDVNCTYLTVSMDALQTRRLHEKRKVTALHIASRRGYNEIVKILLDAKCDKNAQEHDGFTPLHHSARY